MSGLNEETIHRVLQQIQVQLQKSRKELSLVNAQILAKERERKMLQLTVRQLGDVPSEESVRMYKGVGKMFLLQPRSTLEEAHSTEEAALSDEITNLTKKAKYLQKQFDDANSQMKDIFHSQRLRED
ncbi:Prefoldin beta-like [Phaffia rhodozyma]|uniref:Prefoldin beta-like n=1 Tax=Phaffia rhodozyma TaxID=264483 RepID=A0A0F7SNH9_PHARH|nr:Prefoldin beta-like [Phaffia rhodozyma]